MPITTLSCLALLRDQNNPMHGRSWVGSHSLALNQDQDWTQEQSRGPVAACWENGWPRSLLCHAAMVLPSMCSIPLAMQHPSLHAGPIPGSPRMSHPGYHTPAASHLHQHHLLGIPIIIIPSHPQQHHNPSSLASPQGQHLQQHCILISACPH